MNYKAKTIRIFLTTVVALLGFTAVHAGDLFHGTLTFNVTGPDARELKTISLSGDGKLIRVDVLMTERSISIIRNPETKMMTMIIPERKMAMNVVETKAPGSMGIAGDEKGEPTRTISKEIVRILGHDTHLETLVYPNGNKVEAWISEDMGVFSIPEAFAGSMKVWVDGKSVPLRVVKWVKGAEVVRLEATTATKEMPAQDLFIVPSDYQTVTMPSR